MPSTLFALCHDNRRQLFTRRIVQHRDAQEIVQEEFEKLYDSFVNGVEREIPYDGNWKPDSDELFTIGLDRIPNMDALVSTVTGNASAVTELDPGGLSEEGAKGLFVGGPGDDNPWISAQLIRSSQILARRRTFLFANHAYQIVTEPAFSLSDSLTFIVEDGLIKFKSWTGLRQMLNTKEVYLEATDEDIQGFAQHPRLAVADTDQFVRVANQPIRMLIGEVVRLGILDWTGPAELVEIAKQRGNIPLELSADGERLILPTDAPGIRKSLVFLSEHDFVGAITGNYYVSNSRRRG